MISGASKASGGLPLEENEPAFHHDWEARVMAMRLLMGAWRKWNIDAGRHSVETLPPVDYLAMSYYEKWLASLGQSCRSKRGLVDRVPKSQTVERNPDALELVDAADDRGR